MLAWFITGYMTLIYLFISNNYGITLSLNPKSFFEQVNQRSDSVTAGRLYASRQRVERGWCRKNLKP